MSAKLEIKKHRFEVPYENNDIHLKLMADLHYSERFNDEKLDIIYRELCKNKTDYICFLGDLIDSTNVLRTNKEKREKFLRWLENVAKISPLFISLGNHDMVKFDYFSGWQKDLFLSFWKEVSNITRVHLSHFSPHYEDEYVIIHSLESNYNFYSDKFKNESKDILLSQLKKERQFLTDLNSQKIKILLIHSPMIIKDLDVLKLIKEYDFVFSGHMHNGLIPSFIDKYIKGNKGLIAPNRNLFPDNARGVKTYNVDGKKIHHIITGGLTKLSETTGFLSNFNDLIYPMSIDEVEVTPKRISLK